MGHTKHIVGIMSGSSLDGLDMVLCSFVGTNPISWDIVKTGTAALPEKLSQSLQKAHSLSIREMHETEVVLSRFVAREVLDFLEGCEKHVDAIASHGHTIIHAPEDGYTIQIGNGGMIAQLTGIPTISDFRINDVAIGGQGAPIAPIAEVYLLGDADFFVNLGGIANMSFHSSEAVIAFDSCPCNQVLNELAGLNNLPYDDRGMLARSGSVIPALMENWSQLSYFHQPFPKSLDNSWVKEVFFSHVNVPSMKVEDALATAVHFMADQMFRDVLNLVGSDISRERKMVVTGGGAWNEYLIEILTTKMKSINVTLTVPHAQLVNFKEAVLMALMGYLRLEQIPNTIPTVTGAVNPTVGGCIYWADHFRKDKT
jgi:anhydro-N-acetylmuramic acid kinase